MANGAITIENRDDLRAWLEGKPLAWAQVIAARAALRVLPLVSGLRSDEKASGRPVRNLHLAVFRANYISWAARKYPAHDLAIASDSRAASDAAASDSRAAYAAVSAAYAAASDAAAYAAVSAAYAAAAAASASDAAVSAAYAAAAAAAADAAADDIWKAVTFDARRLVSAQSKTGDVDRVAVGLIGASLWLNFERVAEEPATAEGEIAPAGSIGGEVVDGPPPRWAQSAIGELSNNRALSEAGFSPWIAWYRKLVPLGQGKPSSHFGEKLDIDIATQPDEWWQRDAEVVNAEIEGWLEMAAISKLPQASFGNNWVEQEAQLRLGQAGTHSDELAALDRTTSQLHNGLKRRIEDFRSVAELVRDDHGWEGFVPSFERFANAFGCVTDDMPEQLGTIYDVAVEFTSFIDQDNDLRKRPKGNMSALDPERRRAFESIVMAVAPLIRRFPTVQEIDDAAGAYFGNLPDRLISEKLVESASAERLVSDDDRKLLMDILAILGERGHISSKAAVRGNYTIKNLIVASASLVATFYVGATASDFSGKSELVIRASDFLARSEHHVLEFLADAPADLRNSIRIVLEKIGEEPGRTQTPQDASATRVLDRRRKDADDED